jgi:hypothetical protein
MGAGPLIEAGRMTYPLTFEDAKSGAPLFPSFPSVARRSFWAKPAVKFFLFACGFRRLSASSAVAFWFERFR